MPDWLNEGSRPPFYPQHSQQTVAAHAGSMQAPKRPFATISQGGVEPFEGSAHHSKRQQDQADHIDFDNRRKGFSMLTREFVPPPEETTTAYKLAEIGKIAHHSTLGANEYIAAAQTLAQLAETTTLPLHLSIIGTRLQQLSKIAVAHSRSEEITHELAEGFAKFYWNDDTKTETKLEALSDLAAIAEHEETSEEARSKIAKAVHGLTADPDSDIPSHRMPELRKFVQNLHESALLPAGKIYVAHALNDLSSFPHSHIATTDVLRIAKVLRDMQRNRAFETNISKAVRADFIGVLENLISRGNQQAAEIPHRTLKMLKEELNGLQSIE